MIEKNSNKGYILSHSCIIILFIFYAVLILSGLSLAVLAVLNEYTWIKNYTTLIKTIIGSFGIALVGSCIFYSRKLYKHSISPDITFPLTAEDKLRQTGIFMYFFLRPLFAICFSFLIILSFKVGIGVIAVKDQTLNTGFIYL